MFYAEVKLKLSRLKGPKSPSRQQIAYSWVHIQYLLSFMVSLFLYTDMGDAQNASAGVGVHRWTGYYVFKGFLPMPLEQLSVTWTAKYVVCLSHSVLFYPDHPGKTSKQKIEHIVLLILHSPCDPRALLKNSSSGGALQQQWGYL